MMYKLRAFLLLIATALLLNALLVEAAGANQGEEKHLWDSIMSESFRRLRNF